tara:strand:+ start:1299 stop:2222 length:924 start_codon:yes stop_codon:yes gene_type:complete
MINIKNFRNFYSFYNKLKLANPSNFLKTSKFIKKQKIEYFKTADEICKIILYLEKKWKIKKNHSINSYNSLCVETIKEQFYLKKVGTYKSIKENIKNENLYNSLSKMKVYLLGLMLSQIFWLSHFKIISFYKNKVKSFNKKKFLEVGSGHGLLTKYLLENNKKNEGIICDISQQSLNLTKRVINYKKHKSNIKFIKKDFFKFNNKDKFDFIILGEVIEHVKKPKKFLNKAKKLLKPDGKIFISTCSNCAQVDHLYHFKNIRKIKSLLKSVNFKIQHELISPSENIPKKVWQKEKIAINYCAILNKLK